MSLFFFNWDNEIIGILRTWNFVNCFLIHYNESEVWLILDDNCLFFDYLIYTAITDSSVWLSYEN